MVDPNDRRAFCTIVAAACIDGDLSPPEREVLHRKATEYDIPMGVVREIIDLGVQGKLAVAVPPGQSEREGMLDDLIDVACADGRIEAAEHHLLAKFASHLGLQLPDLRARVRQRLQAQPATKPPKREEPSRPAPPPRPEAPRQQTLREQRRPEPPKPPPMADRPVAPPTTPMQDLPAYLPGPITLSPPTLMVCDMADIPPITVQLIRQSILFDTAAETLRYIERTLTVTKPEAEAVLQKILAAFPDLKPGGEHFRTTAPRKS